MQSVCLKDARASGPLAEETSLVGLTFGGYLHSKVFHNFDVSLMSMYSLNLFLFDGHEVILTFAVLLSNYHDWVVR